MKALVLASLLLATPATFAHNHDTADAQYRAIAIRMASATRGSDCNDRDPQFRVTSAQYVPGVHPKGFYVVSPVISGISYRVEIQDGVVMKFQANFETCTDCG